MEIFWEKTLSWGAKMGKAKVFKLGEAVKYNKNAIVSKTLMEGKSGNVTLFAFDAGQKLSEHSAPFDAMVQVIEGRVLLTIGGKPFKVSSGEIVIMPADVPHSVQAVDKFKILLTMLHNRPEK